MKGQKIASSKIDQDSVPTKGEVKALIKGICGSKLRLVVEFLATTGLRISELIRIRLEDVKAADSHYLVRVLGKGQKQRAVKVCQDLIERVRKTYHGRGYLFETSGGKPLGRELVSREIASAGCRILGKHISVHSLRHAFATAAINAGWSDKKVAYATITPSGENTITVSPIIVGGQAYSFDFQWTPGTNQLSMVQSQPVDMPATYEGLLATVDQDKTQSAAAQPAAAAPAEQPVWSTLLTGFSEGNRIFGT
ncbi:MAG: tyrosine-type recombinase/integrase [Spirochaetia bacterium]